MDADVVIVGGGVIGTAIAWRAAREGLTVTLIDPGDDRDKASLVAAGMLGPVSESVFGERDLLNLNLLAISRFPGFSEELEQATGWQTGLRTEGTLAVAYDSGDLAALKRLTAFRHSIGLQAQELDGRQCRQLEPFLAPGTRGGVLATGDLSVDNRRYLAALKEAARAAGVRTIQGTATTVAERGVTVAGTGARLEAAQVVVAAGWAISKIAGVPDPVRKAVRPVKGQILRLRHPRAVPPVATHTIRAIVQGRDVYIVPRADGEVVVGATQEERDDRDATVGAVHDLLRDATTALPALSELILAEISVGLRPGTQDNGPIVGRTDTAGLIVATGHFRNGILLSAATADAVTALLTHRQPRDEWLPFTPGRFG
ncbi:glycine oxidase ThiO [Trebonia sp.]|uniref:glycine oxidase ThiO n=1 Tax=Trebonia sp. TaxID=2767075 RepID=UPI00261D66DE|nr:glycine oxidase ThiO [Trebonia sp.]